LEQQAAKIDSMKAVIYERPGQPEEVLKVIDVPRKTPGPTEVVIRVLAAPIVPADLATIRGVYRTPQKTPTVPGYGCQGEVVEVGSAVTTFKIGDNVLSLPFKKSGWTDGCWQEYLCLEETEFYSVPGHLHVHQTCDFYNTALTAWVMVVEKLNLGAGQTLLLTAAGSNVGRMILGLSKVRGFSVIAVVRRPEQMDEIKSLGAKEVICSTQDDITKKTLSLTGLKGVNAVIDAIGGDISTQCFKALADSGKMIVYGLLDLERNSSFDIRKMLFYNLQLSGFWLPGWWYESDTKTRTAAMNKTFDLIQKSALVPKVEKEYRFQDVVEAVRHAERPGNSGRVILVP
jgi:NADPH:quinone reductase-like Zn-dependent oxidoreductase